MEWTDEAVAKLRTLWADGKSGSAIGAELKTTKHSVIKKARRLGLIGRPSPLKPGTPKPRIPTPAERQAAARAAIGLT